MKIWYDACTGKHIRYGTAIGQRLRKAGHEFIFTTREHPDTLPLAQILGEKPIVVGKYNPSTLSSRLEESAERVIQFSKLFKDNPPDIAIAHQSVELCRTAFGLGIPIILTADTPYATAVNRLTIPFAHTVVVSEALPKRFVKEHCAKNIVQFKGVDEVAWIKDFKPSKIDGLKKPLIVIRQMETKAAYARVKERFSRKSLQKNLPSWEMCILSKDITVRAKRSGLRKALWIRQVWLRMLIWLLATEELSRGKQPFKVFLA